MLFPCNEYHIEGEGLIHHPSYPQNYSNNLNMCVAQIVAPPGTSVVLEVVFFELEFSMDCAFDVLEVRLRTIGIRWNICNPYICRFAEIVSYVMQYIVDNDFVDLSYRAASRRTSLPNSIRAFHNNCKTIWILKMRLSIFCYCIRLYFIHTVNVSGPADLISATERGRERTRGREERGETKEGEGETSSSFESHMLNTPKSSQNKGGNFADGISHFISSNGNALLRFKFLWSLFFGVQIIRNHYLFR